MRGPATTRGAYTLADAGAAPRAPAALPSSNQPMQDPASLNIPGNARQLWRDPVKHKSIKDIPSPSMNQNVPQPAFVTK